MKKLIYLLMFFSIFTFCFAKDLWVEQEVVGSYLFEKIQFLDSLVGFASGQTNLLKTTDGGKTWEEKIMVDFMGNAINNVEMFPDGYGFMMRSQNIYQTSTDFGETWTDHPVPGNHIYNIFYALDHNRIWIGDIAARTIIYTKNGGTTWDSLKLDNYNTFNYIYKCYFFNDDKGLIFTNSGVILKTTN
ncbi:MAG TPA: hypothetical protein P5545_07285, partial [Bacteroidota bacterium]|nr:hypothetical protein [Bacteroidota bacterium]